MYAAGTNNVLYVFEATSGQLKTQLNRIHTPAEALRCHPFSPVLLSHHPIPQSVLVWTVLHQVTLLASFCHRSNLPVLALLL